MPNYFALGQDQSIYTGSDGNGDRNSSDSPQAAAATAMILEAMHQSIIDSRKRTGNPNPDGAGDGARDGAGGGVHSDGTQHDGKPRQKHDDAYLEIPPLKFPKEFKGHGGGWQSQETLELIQDTVGVEPQLLSQLENAFLAGDLKSFQDLIAKYGPGSPEGTDDTGAMKIAFDKTWKAFRSELSDLGFSASLDDTGVLKIDSDGGAPDLKVAGRIVTSISLDSKNQKAGITLLHADQTTETIQCSFESGKVTGHYGFSATGDYQQLPEMTFADAGKLLDSDVRTRQQVGASRERQKQLDETQREEDERIFQEQERERDERLRQSKTP